jgi:dipeptidyl aminopeptidase/acylaminoacyl peptidase
VVLSVNYRLGIGYGNEFHHPPNAGVQGAAEYLDVLAGARWLQAQSNVDPQRVGIFGGSYGGYLTALALARNSDVFAAGVDVHGVHDFTSGVRPGFEVSARIEQAPDLQRAREIAWKSSPVSAVPTWRSPVLLIHGDDDRNVRFSATVDLVQRLEAARVPFEEMVIVDDTHHMHHRANMVRLDSATATFFDRTLAAPATRTARTAAP